MAFRAGYYGVEHHPAFLAHLNRVCGILGLPLQVLRTPFPVHDVHMLLWNFDPLEPQPLKEPLHATYPFVVHLSYEIPMERVVYTSYVPQDGLDTSWRAVRRTPERYVMSDTAAQEMANEWAIIFILDAHRLNAPLIFMLDPTWIPICLSLIKKASSAWMVRS